jgi:enoyl-CoA hydratase
MQRAKDMLMSADFHPAEAALQMGLVMDVVEPEDVLPRALERVAAYAERAPLSVWFAKKAVNVGMQMSQEAGIEFEQSLIGHLYGTDDRKEGVSAFLEKRTATFKGK